MRIWLGYCDAANEDSLTFTELLKCSNLAAIWAAQVGASTPMQTASEGCSPGPPGWSREDAGRSGSRHPWREGQPIRSKAPVLKARTPAQPASQFPSIDPGIVQAALTAGVAPSSRSSRPWSRQVLWQKRTRVAEHPQAGLRGLIPTRGHCVRWRCASSRVGQVSGWVPEGGIKRTKFGSRDSGSQDPSFPTARRNAAARRALKDALVSSPSEISAVIEGLMAEDLASAMPALVFPSMAGASLTCGGLLNGRAPSQGLWTASGPTGQTKLVPGSTLPC